MKLNDILNRRSDLSTFLVHLTRSCDAQTAHDKLCSIIKSRKIEARGVYGHLSNYISQLRNNGEDHKVVCFTETPLEFSYLLVSEIEGRDFHFEPYGIVITKRLGREIGVNPVWYVDITPGHDWITKNLDCLRDRYLENQDGEAYLGKLFPFIEHMGNGPGQEGGYCKEFWWEREWRFIGNFEIPRAIICLCPEQEIDEFRTLLKESGVDGNCIDPRWSLERIIAHLGGFHSDEIEIIRNA